LERLAKLNVTNAGVIVLDAKTGAILAMVGSKDYFDFEQDGQVNVTTSLRQPGSSIKIVNYAYALSSGFTPASVIDDAPITYNVPGSKPYSPQNYDGKFLGKITLRDAFAQSRNVPAVRVLSTYGANSMAEMGRKMGITTWPDNKYYGLSLTLGGGATKLIDLARVYATVADYGSRPNIYSVSQVMDTSGKSIYQVGCLLSNSTCPKEQVLDQRVAFLLTDILRDNTARAPAFGSHSTLVIPNHPEVAVKTGTSNDLRDNLTIGYTQDFVVAVWVGNNDNSPMSRVASGITGASSIWNTIMTSLVARESKKTWEIPNGLALKRVCTKGGKEEWFLEESPLPTCTHEYAKDRPNKQDT
ncbi:penicillin-binding protein 1C, partial [Candidatus Microgenomates bacterium]